MTATKLLSVAKATIAPSKYHVKYLYKSVLYWTLHLRS